MTRVTFDADAFLDTLTPPTIAVGGVTYTGRHLSASQWMRALAMVDRARVTGSLTAWARVAAVVFGAAFPRPWWAVWRPSVTARLLALPPAVWQAALADFFASPMTPGGPVTTTTPPAHPGSASPSTDSSGTSSPPTDGGHGTPLASGTPGTE